MEFTLSHFISLADNGGTTSGVIFSFGHGTMRLTGCSCHCLKFLLFSGVLEIFILFLLSSSFFMALVYSRSFLKAKATSTFQAKCHPSLWRCLTEHGIAKMKPTRRGCRAGQHKHRKLSKRFSSELNQVVSGTSNSLNSLLAFNRVLEDVDNLHNTSEQTLNIQIDTLRDIDEEAFLDTTQDPARLAGITLRISRDDTIASIPLLPVSATRCLAKDGFRG